MNLKIKQRFYGLDHLRALAISFVFLFHYFILSGGQPQWLPAFVRFGWTGVDLFFVLSGFLISSPLFAQINRMQKILFRQFFLKRFFRIIPAYLFTVSIYFYFPFFREKESLPPLWKFLTFTQNFDLNLRENGAFSHAWSLCVEEHFYFLLPLILLLLQRAKLVKKSYLFIVFFLFGFVIRTYCFHYLYAEKSGLEYSGVLWYKYIYYPTYNRLDGLLVGVSIAGIYQFLPAIWNKISKFGNQFLLLSLGVLSAAYFLCYDQQTFYASVFGFPLIAIGYGFAVIGSMCDTSFLYKWNSKITTSIATLSYAIYLTHKGVIHMIHRLLANYEIESNLMLLICMICVLGAAFLLNRAIEKPFMKLRDRIM